jgi:uncharacterized protein YqhQ
LILAQKVYYGGQAVMEGVMMRGRKIIAVAVRRPNGEIVTDTRPLPSIYTGWMRKMPLLRGIIVLIESFVLGIQTLMFSTNIALEDEGEAAGGVKENNSGGWLWLFVAVGLVIGIAVFSLLPLYITRLFNIHSSILFNLVDGIIRLAIFIAYLKAVSLMSTIRRTFAYHGAEHKTVNAYENDAPLEVESVRKFSTAHVRCGTSFLLIFMVIAIIAFALVGKPALWLMVLARIVLLPVIAAVAYEVIYFSGRHTRSWPVRILLTPGLWLQSLTTRKPDDGMLEVAITALKKVLELEEGPPVPVAP